MNDPGDTFSEFDIAIVGMAGRYPDAANVDAFWSNLCQGKESVRFFTDDELRQAGISEASLQQPGYVKAAPVLDDPAGFDARFFGFTPNEAVLMDPQHRLALELAWEAVENAGYDADRLPGRVGVFASSAMNTYLLLSGILPKFVESYLPTLIGSDKDFLATRISYQLGLTGPSMTVQTACSSSLVATHIACQSLLNQECDMALAGGTAIRVPHHAGHQFQEGSVFTPDGHCRPFDAGANGTIFGSGGGMVVLKRLSDAVESRDNIVALIKGSAVNNDGNSKAEYTAPSIESQSEVILEALASANVDADQMAYVEAHGTGTYLGDPIEIAALTKAYRESTDACGYCAIGSVKSNIGHLDAAAGVTALIKTAMAMQQKKLPPSINFEKPNPQIDFANSPFFVNTEMSSWMDDGSPQFAGVTSLGIGGTNAHVVLGPAPTISEQIDSKDWHLLPLAARTEAAVTQSAKLLANDLANAALSKSLADVAYTLQTGRKAFQHRRVTVVENMESAADALLNSDPEISRIGQVDGERRDVVMMFSGQGSQYAGMAQGLYERYASFRNDVDQCAEILQSSLGLDIRELIFADQSDKEKVELLYQTAYTQPALFVVEYSLARLLIDWGIVPSLLVGHSIGEYTAACLANVFTLENALGLVVQRGKLMQSMPSGLMLSVPLPASDLTRYVSDKAEVGCANSSELSVLTGPKDAIESLASRLQSDGIDAKVIHTSHAFHSEMMEPVLGPFAEQVRAANPKAPDIPIQSNLTGEVLLPAQATDPDYWAQHLRNTVQFDSCLTEVFKQPHRVVLEVGPGRALATFARRHAKKAQQVVITTMRTPDENVADPAPLLNAVGRLWLLGLDPNWDSISGDDCRHVPLPTYPFERQRIWPEVRSGGLVESVDDGPSRVQRTEPSHVSRKIEDWTYVPSWQRSNVVPPKPSGDSVGAWLVFTDGNDLVEKLVDKLRANGEQVIPINPGTEFESGDHGRLRIDPDNEAHYDKLVDSLFDSDANRYCVLHGWTCGQWKESLSVENLDKSLSRSMYSLMHMAAGLGRRDDLPPVSIYTISSEVQQVFAYDRVRADKATVLAPCKIIPEEQKQIACRAIDVEIPAPGSVEEGLLVDQLVGELTVASNDPVVAYRGGYRWLETFSKTPITESVKAESKLRSEGTYLITGGLGGIGLEIAGGLAKSLKNPNLILLSRRPLPDRNEWQGLSADSKDPSICRKISKVLELESSGAIVLVAAADVSAPSEMATLAEDIKNRFGLVNGIVHAAGVVDEAGKISERSQQAHHEAIKSKMHGSLTLEKVFDSAELDFIVHCSSLATVLFHKRFGHFAQIGYVAANGFLDSLSSQPRSGRPTVTTINWDEWSDVGMGARAQAEFKAKYDLADDVFDNVVRCSPADGVELFQRALGAGIPRILVSPRDLSSLLMTDSSVGSSNLQSVQGALEDDAEPSSLSVESKDTAAETVSSVWRQVTGFTAIDPHDNFFELGGSSLMATQVMARLREATGIDLGVKELFENPTVAKLAKYLSSVTNDRDENDEHRTDPGEPEELVGGAL